MRESRTYGSVRGALSNERPYRDRSVPTIFSIVERWRARRLRAFAHPTTVFAEATGYYPPSAPCVFT